jgi:selenocysteine lyase/cysteine desulfurase
MNYKELFSLPQELVYLNCAYMSPILKSVEQKGIEALIKKRNPTAFGPDDYFDDANAIRMEFSKLVHSEPSQIAIVPSASYGLKTAVNNVPQNNGTHALVVGHEFPSGYYAAERWCNDYQKELVVIHSPEESQGRGKTWNEKILERINQNTAFVLMSSVHWTDGTRFDLEAIGQKCRETNTLFIVDGTQSVGAAEIDVQACNISALICAGYKWLMGPYGLGVAYFSEAFHQGKPLEETWMARSNAKQFASLTNYVSTYKDGAARFDMGEVASFNLVPMLLEALRNINAWKPAHISAHSRSISTDFISYLEKNNFEIEEAQFRSSHLFGFRLKPNITTEALMQRLKEANISVSLRGSSIRVSPHLYNTSADFNALQSVLDSFA